MGARKRKYSDEHDSAGYSVSIPGSTSWPVNAGPIQAPPPKKRARTKKDPDAPPPEKRGAVFKKRCPQNIMERVERVMSQRFFLVDRRRVGEELKEEFSVLGSTGNVYTVTIDKTPRCTCPDSVKGNHCKHILFIFLKVLQVTQASGHWYQKALLTSELETIYAEAPPAPETIANACIRQAYAKATGAVAAATVEDTGGKKRLPSPEDDCPVCYEKLHGVSQTLLSFCEECGNPIHNECFEQWANRTRPNVTCVYCRARWVSAGPSGSGGGAVQRSAEGYLNLAGVAGLDPVRDTSTYYSGPRKGKRYYGYQNYY